MTGPRKALDDLSEAAVSELHSIVDFVRWGASRFAGAGLCFGHGTDNAVDEAMVLVLHAVALEPGVPTEILGARLTASEKREVAALVQRRIEERVPAAYLTNRAWFAGLAFYVDERVLVPRSPLAECIERAFEPWVDAGRVRRILDVGTGSGCIAIACAYAFPEAVVDAVDVSEDALAVARLNVREHAMEDRVRVACGDLFAGVDGRYDLIVSNPPYVDAHAMSSLPEEFRQEPRVGLEGGAQGLDFAVRILRDAPDYLTEEGVLVLEVGASRPALERRFPDAPFVWLELERGGEGVLVVAARDLSGYDFDAGEPVGGRPPR